MARNSHDFGIVMSFLQLKSEMDFATKKALRLFFLQMSRLQIVILIFSKTHKGISSPAFVSRQWNLDSIHKPFPMSSSAELDKTKNEFFGEISAVAIVTDYKEGISLRENFPVVDKIWP